MIHQNNLRRVGNKWGQSLLQPKMRMDVMAAVAARGTVPIYRGGAV